MCQAAERRFDLVTTDVDGTLLSTKNELSPRNEEAIAECIKLGIPVCIGAQSHTLWIFLQAWAENSCHRCTIRLGFLVEP